MEQLIKDERTARLALWKACQFGDTEAAMIAWAEWIKAYAVLENAQRQQMTQAEFAAYLRLLANKLDDPEAGGSAGTATPDEWWRSVTAE